MLHKEREDAKYDTHEGENPPAAHAKIIFGLDDDGVEHAYDEESAGPKDEAAEVQIHEYEAIRLLIIGRG